MKTHIYTRHCEPFAFCHPEGALRPCHLEERSDEGSGSGQAPRPKDLPQGKLRVAIWSHPHLASPIKGEGNVEGALLFLPPLAGGS
jgi:hypothetical protein